MNRFLSAAQSVFNYIRSTAEPDSGGFRWKTYDYGDEPQYHFNVFNGVGGIPLFLCKYYKATANREALDLAAGAIRWCMDAKPSTGCWERGLQTGRTGVAYSALEYAEAAGSDEFLPFARRNGEFICSEPPGPVADLLGGEASNGWFLLRLWNSTGEERFLEGAIRCARWIALHVIRDEQGAYCLAEPVNKSFGDRAFTGLSHGISGMALFLACLYQATGDCEWKQLGLELFQTLVDTGVEVHGGWNWGIRLGSRELTRCQYSHGSAGIGLAFVRSAEALNEETLLQAALRAGEATWHYGDFRNNPTLCTGLAGGGELLLALFKATGDPLWASRAEAFGDLALAYRDETSEGDRWPTDTPGLFSPDFTYGASGTGYFFLGLNDPEQHTPPMV